MVYMEMRLTFTGYINRRVYLGVSEIDVGPNDRGEFEL